VSNKDSIFKQVLHIFFLKIISEIFGDLLKQIYRIFSIYGSHQYI